MNGKTIMLSIMAISAILTLTMTTSTFAEPPHNIQSFEDLNPLLDEASGLLGILFNNVDILSDHIDDLESNTGKIYVNRHAEFTDGQSTKEFLVSCDEGDVATGGGFNTSSNNHTVKRSQPSPDETGDTPNAWLVSLRDLDTTPGNSIEVHVVCMDITP